MEKLCMANGFTKTEFVVSVRTNVYRRVWSKSEKYYVSYRGFIRDVSMLAKRFEIKTNDIK